METEPLDTTSIVRADIELFKKNEKEIIEVERELIENSSSDHLFDEQDELDFMYNALNQGGFAYLVMEEDKLIGFMVVGPLDDGSDLPDAVTQNFPIENCLHIKMMYVKNTNRGIGSSLINQLLEEIDKDKWKYLFVRTWVEPANEGAIKFYTEKAGFEIILNSIVESTKTKADQSGTFQIKRQYFSRKV
jgi:ribosomal protein S18 acetylase RimI-like enzyme